MRKSLEAEMWFVRRMLKIPWTESETNEEISRRAKDKRYLITMIRRRKIGFAGHI